jgi:ribose transport system ATP-binding protein
MNVGASTEQPVPPLIELTGISKAFGGVIALDDVSFRLHPAEVQALVGENGAGKSTLIKILAGIYQADAGVYRFKGEEQQLGSARDAFALGIAVVHQERSLIPTFSVAENIFLDRVVGRSLSLIQARHLNVESQPLMEAVGLRVRASRIVSGLSPAQQQLIEIARALAAGARIILMDEPTSSLSVAEVERLLSTVERLKADGVAVLLVTHKLEEVFAAADLVTVLRDGRNAGSTVPIRQLDRDRLVTLMVGRPEVAAPTDVRSRPEGEVILEAVELTSRSVRKPATFRLHQREILGWYGLVGAGRTELARAVLGADGRARGQLWVRGKLARPRSVSQAVDRWRIGYVSENRQEEGLFLAHSIVRNLTVTVWHRLGGRTGWVRRRAERAVAQRYRGDLSIRASTLEQEVGQLSGGNQQKVSIAKWLAARLDVLFFDEPTVGIDVVTKFEVHRLIRSLSDEGMSLVVISSDLPELITLVDRVLVFRDGAIVGELENTRDYPSMSAQIMGLIVSGREQPRSA